MKAYVKKVILRERARYLQWLEGFEEKGIPIFIDDMPANRAEFPKIFENKGDGCCYMGDYIGVDEGKLTEIRFDRVWNY
ncbi:MAG: hypothetical protein LBR77_02715 [Lachnospiraceae bacterium]|nr:hypothetical protein [Lachnospiraceae bacterium]